MQEQHAELKAIAGAVDAVKDHTVMWMNGTLPLRVRSYIGRPTLPDELVTSIRCLVQVGDRVVYCHNSDGGGHPWPGGRREKAESFAETASREVHEETGWHVDDTSFRQLGWLRFTHLSDPGPAYPYPTPDFLQVVLSARAHTRSIGENDEWVDIEGQVRTLGPLSIEEVRGQPGCDDMSREFLSLLD